MDSAKEVLGKINFRSFYQRRIPGFNPKGKEALTLCPFHDDKTPSFSVNTDTGLYFCHACGETGNPINFIRKKEGLGFKEALKKLKEEEGIEDPTLTPALSLKAREKKASYLDLGQVKMIHKQLLKNAGVLEGFKARYGLSAETIEKRFIGYQNEHFVIPIEVDSGKWTFKEHKGTQLKGAKVSLYPVDVLTHPHPDPLPEGEGKKGKTVIITEGEFKALLLNQMGFPAVSSTGGANTWKREWNDLFSGLDVVLAYDNDEPGQQGALRVADRLRGTAKSVKAVKWPSMMDGKDKKDVTDYFVTLGKTKEDFQRLLENAEDIGRPIKEIDGFRFVEPEGFEVMVDRMINTVYFKDMPIKKVFFYAPLLITGRAIDIDDGTEEVEITFKRDRKWKSLWLSKRVISDTKKIVELADHGLGINSNNAKTAIGYLAAFEAYNMDMIRNNFITRSTGWKLAVDKQVFVMNRTVSRGSKRQVSDSQETAIDFRPDYDFERFVRAMEPAGTYLKWREAVTGAIKSPYAGFAFYAAFAAPLLKVFTSSSFIIHFWGNTSVGKTTVLELASSVWGNPHKENGGLVFGWDSTKVFLERMAGFFCDMPIFPDDSQNVEDKMMAKMLYQLANGAGKGRGSLTGIQHTRTWRTIVFSTGERKLTECTTFGGARARVLELYGSPFGKSNGVFINEFKQAVRENYGHAGAKFIEGLLPILEKPDEVTRLKAEFKRYQQMLSREANSEIGDRISQYFATVKIAADLVHRILGIGDPAEAEDAIFRVFRTVLEESRDTGDMPTNAMGHVLSWVSRLWISGNDGYFFGGGNDPYGYIMRGVWIGIFRDKLAEVMKKEGYSENAVLRAWADRDWIKREDDTHYTCARRIKTDNAGPATKRFIIIPWDVYRKFITGDKDDF